VTITVRLSKRLIDSTGIRENVHRSMSLVRLTLAGYHDLLLGVGAAAEREAASIVAPIAD